MQRCFTLWALLVVRKTQLLYTVSEPRDLPKTVSKRVFELRLFGYSHWAVFVPGSECAIITKKLVVSWV